MSSLFSCAYPLRFWSCLAFDAAFVKSALDEPFLEDDIQEHGRNERNNRSGKYPGIVGGIFVVEHEERDRQGAHRFVLDNDQRRKIFLPRSLKSEHGQRADCRQRLGKVNVPENAPVAAAVDQHRLLVFLRNALEEASQEERASDDPAADINQPQAPIRIDQAERFDDQELRDDVDDARNHHRQQESAEQNLLTRKLEPCKSVSRQAAQEHAADHRNSSDKRTVEEVSRKIVFAPYEHIVIQIRSNRKDLRRPRQRVGAFDEGRHDHISEGEQKSQCSQNDNGVYEELR